MAARTGEAQASSSVETASSAGSRDGKPKVWENSATRPARVRASALTSGRAAGGVRASAPSDSWQKRRTALASYRDRLTAADAPDPDAVLAALLHLHHARMSGIDRASERLCLRLARAAALRWTRTSPSRPQ